jgi:hypothetical protein
VSGAPRFRRNARAAQFSRWAQSILTKENYMKVTIVFKVITIAAVAASSSVAFSASWVNKNVANLQSMFSGADCFYFTLEGVSEADPVVPGSPWFAVPRTQFGAKDGYAMLLSAKLSGQSVVVTTKAQLHVVLPLSIRFTCSRSCPTSGSRMTAKSLRALVPSLRSAASEPQR